MQKINAILKNMTEYRALLQEATKGGVISLYGMSPIHRAHFASALREDLHRPMCIITRDEGAAAAFARDFEHLSDEKPIFLPSRDFIFHNIDNVSRDFEQQRLGALAKLSAGKSPILVAAADALMLRTVPRRVLKAASFTICQNLDYNLNHLARQLVDSGYVRAEQVEGPGQFALRGGILDLFPAGAASPVRAEFFGDTVDSLGIFDPMTQRRSRNVKEVVVLPARETLPHMAEGGITGLCKALEGLLKKASPQTQATLMNDIERLRELGSIAASDRYMEQIYGEFASAMDYLPADTIIISCDTPGVLECARGLAGRQNEDVSGLLADGVLPPSKQGWSLGFEQFKGALSSYTLVMFDSFLNANGFSPTAILAINAKQLPSYSGSIDTAAADISGYLDMGYTIFALAGGSVRAQNFKLLLEARNIACVSDENQARSGVVCVLSSNLSAGFEYSSAKLAVICEGQPQVKHKQASESDRNKKNRLRSYTDLTPGDLVVHDHHGIGRFVGVERIQTDGVWRDYIKIAFAGTDFVFVPATSLDLISKYIGSRDGDVIKLSKLGGATWQKTKQRAKKSALDLAEGLIALYSARQNAEGFAFLPDDDWQRSFEEAFEFDETDDQLTCTREIKSDMQKSHPMDRLLCGDVGFGKTEVAFRAVMKCILSGKQAAILVPTTVLARQHFLSACQRFAGYPIKIEMMSRFRTAAQLKETAKRVKRGECDLLIGTHRILQKDITFKNLGLLVVDEEQRFGVTHKELIKKMTNAVDVLTLTATPLPRTLNMALSGIRDMSVLEEAPVGRQPVQTYVLEHDDAVVRDAIRRELARGGQVYYLHNRVESIDSVAKKLRESFPETAIGVAHGRMNEVQMSNVMNKMYAGEISVLICTTIIETGVDIPNVNTLIIENADYMGLAQLHQIRGRVGRSQRHAYAYLTYKRGKVLSEISQKRLSAIREFAEFGSGFKIAMRDLEIRGAGNILGAEQSGHMMNVGYDMYLRLLEEASAELKGEAPAQRTDCTADILVSASLPQSYIADAGTRVDLYRRIALITSREDYLDMQDEMLDRFGDIPQSALSLLDIALLRAQASKGGITEITQKNTALLFYFSENALERASKACGNTAYRGRLLLSAGEKPYICLRLRPSENPLKAAIDFIKTY